MAMSSQPQEAKRVQSESASLWHVAILLWAEAAGAAGAPSPNAMREIFSQEAVFSAVFLGDMLY